MESDCGVIYTPRYPPKQQSNQQTINEAKKKTGPNTSKGKQPNGKSRERESQRAFLKLLSTQGGYVHD